MKQRLIIMLRIFEILTNYQEYEYLGFRTRPGVFLSENKHPTKSINKFPSIIPYIAFLKNLILAKAS